ncbi:MAG: LLM class flavin-dependent oxidoreductase, partial [Candidatus Tectomicrobia bacterium]|nr:LLM class flavin-dependent oxidoreductase [Candidatus Tectomicrobia bacterium]
MSKIGIGFPIRGGLSRNESIEIVKLADELGYDSVWVDENWRWEAFTTLTHIACHTSRIKLGTSIVPVFSRSPSLLAMTSATLDE